MKNLILLTCLFISMCAFAQNEKEFLNQLNEVEVSPPEFTGIENVVAFQEKDDRARVRDYIVENMKYPETSVDSYREGTEIVQFTVSPEGKVSDFVVINSVSRSIDKEMIRVLKTTSGMWEPGLNNGLPTAMEKEVSILFKIDAMDQNTTIKYFIDKATRHYKVAANNLIEKQNARKALKHFNMGMVYLPNDLSLLTMRGICKYELGDEKGAREDWERINKLARENGSASEFKFLADTHETSKFKGYAEMTSILNK